MVNTPLLFGLLTLNFFQLSKLSNAQVKAIYAKRRSFVPDWLFGWIWLILYVGLTVAGYYAFDSSQENEYYVPLVILYVVNIFLAKYWPVEFFDNENPWRAFLVSVALDLTAVPVAALLGVLELWVSLGIYTAYVVWLLFATILNIQWYQAEGGEEEKEALLPMRIPKARPKVVWGPARKPPRYPMVNVI